MALSMHTNYASLVTQNTLNNTSGLLNTAMERLSTGFRVNSAADDAAGLQIANRLEAQSRGMNVAMRNAQDGISMMQTAEGAMDEMTNIAYRMNDLATQASNGTNSDADLASLSSEFQALGAELENIITNTNFGGNNLLDAGGAISTGVTFQIGASQAETLSIGGAGAASTDGLAALKAFAADAKAADFTAAGGDSPQSMMDALSINSDTKADGTAGTAADGGVIGQLGAVRSDLGANINRLEHTMTNLGNMVENTTAAKGRIMDADFAVESSNMTKNQMLMQAGTTVLSQTNQLPGMAMSLLR
ncbi:lateral flagellin [Vibrio rotiferianus]|uniref:Flagellin n=1 Tax=Vibrio rotiferianus TaxID=190895 RepID=A0A510IHN5_9VIBR|nr:lateral flagellin LafA [Vibrio rotiferianus]ASI93947.1 Lateral flagellin [Vibrio rotiferianus]BBL91740.1 lateral flagellin [Vibrio rotiferianus]